MEDNRDLLEEYRSSIDNVDASLIHLLAERFRITHQVGVYKAENGLPAEDKEREAEQVIRMRQLTEDAGIDPVFSEKFLRFIIDEVIRHHVAIDTDIPSD